VAFKGSFSFSISASYPLTDSLSPFATMQELKSFPPLYCSFLILRYTTLGVIPSGRDRRNEIAWERELRVISWRGVWFSRKSM